MDEIISDLEITTLVHGGRGLGRHEGKAVFVPLTLPGDRVACRSVKSSSRFIEAELVDVLVPSQLRRQPPCPLFGTCGGCQWQHLPYHEQVRWKEKIYAELMVRNQVAPAVRIREIVAAPDQWNYRNRVQLKCHQVNDGMAIGFYRHGSHFVIDVDRCLVVAPQIQRVIDILHGELPQAPDGDCIPQVDVACGDDGAVRIVVHVLPKSRKPLSLWLRDFACRHDINVCIQSGRKETLEIVHGVAHLTVAVDNSGLSLHYGPGGFVQGNSEQNRNMVSRMLEMLKPEGAERVLDLFCGMGNFSLPLARRTGWVVGVEDYAPSIASARENAAINEIHNVEFHAVDATRFMQRAHPEEFDLVVLDPPRTGCRQTVQELLRIKPRSVLYVSCDPATLVRDLMPLVHGGYEVVAGQPLDLFPQTWHIESLTLLKRCDSV
ncbi:MAG: class I SAM-dependent RNA methyltransferase [Desulfuromonadales bacterium]